MKLITPNTIILNANDPMSKFNRYFLYAIMIVALLPLIPAVIAGAVALSPLMLLIAIVFGLTALKSLGRGVGSFGGLMGGLISAIGSIFSGIFSVFGWLFGFTSPSARFMGSWERWRLLNSTNAGFLVDGRRSRLSEKASYESVLIQGGMGRGKSSAFVMPNLLDPPPTEPSFVISDTSGEIYKNVNLGVK